MAFSIRRKDSFDYQTPQEMYQDNKIKKIRGLLDYQGTMIDEYMKNISQKNIALELPTGSGKTLIGLLIGEFRRKKFKESIVFLCTTRQLVNQVVEQAQKKFGIKATAFVGSQKEYDPISKTEFTLGETIAVTTYSAFFTQELFSRVDIAILDDVHSSEDYIMSNWTIKITGSDPVFSVLTSILCNILSNSNYERLTSDEAYGDDVNGWCELLPMTLLDKYINEIYICLKENIKEKTSNYYAWNRISENLSECNFYVSNKMVLIRPWLAPTKTCGAFANLKQRILMSATLGKSGELERLTGLSNISRLPIVNDWDKRGLGRRFFIMPDLSLGADYEGDVLIRLHQLTGKKSVVLTPTDEEANGINEFINDYMKDTVVYSAKGIESTKKSFLMESDAIITMANRFDGVDFSDDESRMLFVRNLPKMVNIQESFLINKMGAAILYNERIRTRIIQAVGRCTRNPSDYAVVCVFGDTIRNDLIKNEKLSLFPPELRAELQFGIEQSSLYKNVNDILEQVNDFLERNSIWQDAEESIVELRNTYYNEKNETNDAILLKLCKAAELEVAYQYDMWKKDYESAYNHVINIIDSLNAPSLGGYKCFWQYIAGSLAYRLLKKGNSVYKQKSLQLYRDALKANIKIHWILELIDQIDQIDNLENNVKGNYVETNYVDDIIDKLENNLSKNSVNKKLVKMFNDIIENLESSDGNKFELGHKNLGTMLGYEADDSKAGAAPDPYWIINSKLCIVAEDKIYESEEASIPVKHVREAITHDMWLIRNEKRIDKDCKIITVFITNAKKIDEDAKAFAENIYYLNKNDLLAYACKAVSFITKINNSFTDIGDYTWRQSVIAGMVDEGLTPKDFIKLIMKNKLEEIS